MDLQALFQNTDRSTLERFLLSQLHRTLLHYGLWLREAIHQMGEEKAFRLEEEVWERVWENHLRRLGKVTGFEVRNNLPHWIQTLDEQQLLGLIQALSVNWLAVDGIWFQAVEREASMVEAKLANDTCWGRFSPLEAREIKTLLNLPDQGGLDALKTALAHRMYAPLNTMTIEDLPDEHAVVLYINDCRVQSARKRKGLEDYPCKSGGTIEYTYFARSIDSRIETECIGCPPDPHPSEWFCAWKFKLAT